MKTIFVTGGAGFIGSNYLNKHVVENPGISYVNIDALTYAGDLTNVKVSDEKNYCFEQVDIRDQSALRGLFEKYQPDAVIHFAAESHVDFGLKNPNLFLETNIIGTSNLLALAVDFNIERFHYVSTDEVYGALAIDDPSFLETNLLRPRNQYSASKAGAELMVISYHETYGLNIVITRSCNTFGPNQDDSKLIPKFIKTIADDKPVPLYGKGEQIREWLFVEDCVDGIHKVFTEGKSGEVYNVGGGTEMTNYDLTIKLLESFGKDEAHISYVEDRKGHDFRYSLNISKIKDELNWSPKFEFREALQKTLDSYRDQ